MDKISTYRGKPIEEMSREELIDALNFLANDSKQEREEHIRQLDVLASIDSTQTKKAKILKAAFVFILFIASVTLAYIRFGWQMAVVIALGIMSASGSGR